MGAYTVLVTGSPGLVIMVVWFQEGEGKSISLPQDQAQHPHIIFQLPSIVKEMYAHLRLSGMSCKGTSYKSGFQGMNNWGGPFYSQSTTECVRWSLFLFLKIFEIEFKKYIHLYKMFNIINKNIRLGVVSRILRWSPRFLPLGTHITSNPSPSDLEKDLWIQWESLPWSLPSTAKAQWGRFPDRDVMWGCPCRASLVAQW